MNGKKIKGLSIFILTMVFVVVFSNNAFAYSELDIEAENSWVDEVVDYMNENAKEIKTGEEVYVIPLSDGSTATSKVSVVEVPENDSEISTFSYVFGESGSDNSKAQPGKSYVFTWTIDRDGFLGGSFTQTSKYKTDSSRKNGKLHLRGTSTTINATPPRLYGVVDKDSYFTKSIGNTISTKSYVKFGIDVTARVVRYSCYFDVDFTGNYDSVTANYSHSWI